MEGPAGPAGGDYTQVDDGRVEGSVLPPPVPQPHAGLAKIEALLKEQDDIALASAESAGNGGGSALERLLAEQEAAAAARARHFAELAAAREAERDADVSAMKERALDKARAAAAAAAQAEELASGVMAARQARAVDRRHSPVHRAGRELARVSPRAGDIGSFAPMDARALELASKARAEKRRQQRQAKLDALAREMELSREQAARAHDQRVADASGAAERRAAQLSRLSLLEGGRDRRSEPGYNPDKAALDRAVAAELEAARQHHHVRAVGATPDSRVEDEGRNHFRGNVAVPRAVDRKPDASELPAAGGRRPQRNGDESAAAPWGWQDARPEPTPEPEVQHRRHEHHDEYSRAAPRRHADSRSAAAVPARHQPSRARPGVPRRSPRFAAAPERGGVPWGIMEPPDDPSPRRRRNVEAPVVPEATTTPRVAHARARAQRSQPPPWGAPEPVEDDVGVRGGRQARRRSVSAAMEPGEASRAANRRAGVPAGHGSPGRRRSVSPAAPLPVSAAPLPAGDEPAALDGRLLAAGAVRATKETGAVSRHDLILKIERLTGSASGHAGHSEAKPAVERRMKAFERIHERRNKLRRLLGIAEVSVPQDDQLRPAGGAASQPQPKTYIA